jgi:tRNA (guanosine-2'-O-)-methyltransferase
VTLAARPRDLSATRVVARGLCAALFAAGCAPQPTPGASSAPGAPAAGRSRTAVPSAPELCGNAADDNENGLADEGCGLATGLAQFLTAWEEPNADVDLRVVDPNGELVEVGRPTKSGLVKERDCPGRKLDCGSQNLEIVYLEQGKLLRGDYRVRIRLVSLGGADPPVSVHFWARVGYRSFGTSFELTRPEGEWTTVLTL